MRISKRSKWPCPPDELADWRQQARANRTIALTDCYWRRQRGFTQERLAERIAMRRNTIWLIETGHPTRARTARLLATALDVDVADLTATATRGTIFQPVSANPRAKQSSILPSMQVEDVGKLTDLSYWRLVYDDHGHFQEFANERLDNLEHVALYVRRHFAHCLTCASSKRPMVIEASIVAPDEFHQMVSPDEMRRLIEALRQGGDELLAQRFDRILRQTRHESTAQLELDC